MGAFRKFHVVSLAVNLPGPLAAAILKSSGCKLTKVEPPEGDPMNLHFPEYYRKLTKGQRVVKLDLKSEKDRKKFFQLLKGTDLLLSSSRPQSLDNLGLSWKSLRRKFPRLSQLAIVGYPKPKQNEAGHDLTYQAEMGTLTPPSMPLTCWADIAGAQKAAFSALALLFEKQLTKKNRYQEIALSDALIPFLEPYRFGLSAPGGLLGGGVPNYNLYQSKDGWVALAALEPHFFRTLKGKLSLRSGSVEELKNIFTTRTSAEWKEWADENDIPLSPVRSLSQLQRSPS